MPDFPLRGPVGPQYFCLTSDFDDNLDDLEVYEVGSVELSAGFAIRHTSSEDLLGRFTSRHPSSEDLLVKFTSRHTSTEDFLGEFSLRQLTSEELLAEFTSRQLTTRELLGTFSATRLWVHSVTVSPSRVQRSGANTAELRVDWHDEGDLTTDKYTVEFYARSPESVEHGPYSGSVTKEGAKEYHATYDWNPPDDCDLGDYDLKATVDASE